MLDDAAFDVEEWLAGEIAMEFAKAEGGGFRVRVGGVAAEGVSDVGDCGDCGWGSGFRDLAVSRERDGGGTFRRTRRSG
ncbi:hypothetical protein [Sphingomonas sp. H160509]|uniref:hypothetical protein n=1 Tax=Sphingomonas sp. H160509 TaxID=2955313 RepID=UPI00406CDFBA